MFLCHIVEVIASKKVVFKTVGQKCPCVVIDENTVLQSNVVLKFENFIIFEEWFTVVKGDGIITEDSSLESLHGEFGVTTINGNHQDMTSFSLQ